MIGYTANRSRAGICIVVPITIIVIGISFVLAAEKAGEKKKRGNNKK